MHQSGFDIRPLKPEEARAVHELIARVFMRFVAPGFEQEGIDEFFRYIDPAALAERLANGEMILTARKADELAGVAALRPPGHISLLFVDEKHQGSGLGAGLLENAVRGFKANHPESAAITVNASPNAVAFYERMGFKPTAEETTTNGIRYQPMIRLEMD